MTANVFAAVFRSKMAAFLLGAACLTLAISPADAAVRAVVGKPLQEAQSMAAAGNYSGAMAKIRQAEGAGGLTGEENSLISRMKAYVQSRQSGGSDTPRGKFDNDYRNGRWSAVIADGESLRKSGQLDGARLTAMAESYYRSSNFDGCLRFIKGNFGASPGDTVLQIQVACAFGAQDDETQRSALEQLVAHNQTPQYWGQLLKVSERMRALKDHQTLDIYRLKMLADTPAGPDYTLTAKLCLEFGLASEAQAMIQKGIDAKLLTDTSATPRLMGMAKNQAGTNAAQWNAKLAAAKSSPSGEDLVKLGEDLTGQGKGKDAIALIQQGIAKGKLDLDNANMRLGQAYLGAGQKADAIKAFNQVKGTPNNEKIAHLWVLFARK